MKKGTRYCLMKTEGGGSIHFDKLSCRQVSFSGITRVTWNRAITNWCRIIRQNVFPYISKYYAHSEGAPMVYPCTVLLHSRPFSRLKGTVSRDFRLLVFFMDQFPPSIWVYHDGHFNFFRKFAEIFAAQGAPPVSMTPVANGKNLQAEKF